jgi:hypothetical protein
METEKCFGLSQEQMKEAREKYAQGFGYMVQFEERPSGSSCRWKEVGSPMYFKTFDDVREYQDNRMLSCENQVRWIVFLNELKGK